LRKKSVVEVGFGVASVAGELVSSAGAASDLRSEWHEIEGVVNGFIELGDEASGAEVVTQNRVGGAVAILSDEPATGINVASVPVAGAADIGDDFPVDAADVALCTA